RQLNLLVANQFGPLHVDTRRADLLLVPDNKDLTNQPPAPDENTINVNHYKCYRVKVTPGTPKFTVTTVNVKDQFIGVTPKSFVLKKMRHLCNAVEKNGEPRKNVDAHLACYQARPAPGQPKHVRQSGVHTNDQFGPEIVGTIKESELCVPSVLP